MSTTDTPCWRNVLHHRALSIFLLGCCLSLPAPAKEPHESSRKDRHAAGAANGGRATTLGKGGVGSAARGAGGSGAGAPGLGCGRSARGVLEPGDAELNDGTWVDTYRPTLDRLTLVTLDMSADDFETYVFVVDAAGVTVAEGRSSVTLLLPPGEYAVLANNFEPLPDGEYAYELEMSCEVFPAVGCGESVQGALDPEDFELEDGTWIETYTLTLTAPTRVTASMSAPGFDPYVYVFDERDSILRQGEAPLDVVLAPGVYLLDANNLAVLPDGTYPYTLQLACAAAPTIACGRTVPGVLDASDPQFCDGSRYDTYVVRLPSPATVSFTMTSDAFDPYVLVLNEAYEDLAQGPPPVELILSGRYQYVQANSSTALPDGAYAYDLTMTCVDGGVCPGDCNGDGTVDVSDLVITVAVVLGVTPETECEAADHDQDGVMAVNDVVAAVVAARGVCAP